MRSANLGPAAQAERDRQMIKARAAAARRPAKAQEDPATLALFAGVFEPRLI